MEQICAARSFSGPTICETFAQPGCDPFRNYTMLSAKVIHKRQYLLLECDMDLSPEH